MKEKRLYLRIWVVYLLVCIEFVLLLLMSGETKDFLTFLISKSFMLLFFVLIGFVLIRYTKEEE